MVKYVDNLDKSSGCVLSLKIDLSNVYNKNCYCKNNPDYAIAVWTSENPPIAHKLINLSTLCVVDNIFEQTNWQKY